MPHRILIIDDDPGFLQGIRKILGSTGADLDLTDTLAEAQRFLAGHRYDIVITDLRLTNVMSEEGIEILRLVKERHPDTHCILITGYGSPELEARAIALGVSCYFEKPVDPKKLLEAVQVLLTG
jgi:DNA-binding NtrC family response regulator